MSEQRVSPKGIQFLCRIEKETEAWWEWDCFSRHQGRGHRRSHIPTTFLALRTPAHQAGHWSGYFLLNSEMILGLS